MSTLQQVKFKEKTLWFVAELGETEGALCNQPEDFENGNESYAHIFEDGSIMRFSKQIGVFKDLVFTGVRRDENPNINAFGNLSKWPSLTG